MADINIVIHRARPFAGLLFVIVGVVLLIQDFWWSGLSIVLVGLGVGGPKLRHWLDGLSGDDT